MNTTTTTPTAATFKKAGFLHHANMDFRDDGTSFKVFSYDDVFVSFAKNDGDVYASIRLDYNGLNFSDYRNLKSYSLLNEFNGVDAYEFNMDAFVANIETVKAELEATNNR